MFERGATQLTSRKERRIAPFWVPGSGHREDFRMAGLSGLPLVRQLLCVPVGMHGTRPGHDGALLFIVIKAGLTASRGAI